MPKVLVSNNSELLRHFTAPPFQRLGLQLLVARNAKEAAAMFMKEEPPLVVLDAEQKRKAREVNLAEGEIQRRLVTLGTLVNLNRIEDPQFGELYQRIDRLRGAITARTTEIEKLTAEREAYDRGTLVRGVATIGGAFVALIALIVILRAVL